MKRPGIEVELALGLLLMLVIMISVFYVLLTNPVSNGGLQIDANKTRCISTFLYKK